MNWGQRWRMRQGKPKEQDFIKAVQPDVLPETGDPEYLDAEEAAAQWAEAETPHEIDKSTT